ncbi:MAG TPA: hypothetical protein VIG38_07485 [Hyphomicrobium sp.]|jgi:hypothetical protein
MPGLRCALLAFSILLLTPTAGECAEGAPQTPPPETALKPCKPRAHDKDGWTVYECWSGC